MPAKQINIDPKEKTINIFVDDTTIMEIESILRHYIGLNDYKIFIHNPNQSTDLVNVYSDDVKIDNLYKIK